MTETILWLCAALALVFAINLVPAFMPSTWMVLAFFYVELDLPLLPLTIGGAIVSGFGRLLLARGSTWVKRRFASSRRADLDELGLFLDERRSYLAPTVFVYSLTPLPTNNLFIAAGMIEANMVLMLAGFWSARILADTFWVWTTDRAFDSVSDVFRGGVGNAAAIALQIAGVVSVAAIYALPWARWLRRVANRRRPAAS